MPETVAALVRRVGLTASVTRAASNPNMPDPGPESRLDPYRVHWLITLTCQDRTMSTPYTTGSGIAWRIRLGVHRERRYMGRPGVCDYCGERWPCLQVRNGGKPVQPDAADVLGCLRSDSRGYDDARTFEDWCAEYGYDTDSRRAERTYHVCAEQAKQLRRLLGAALYADLMAAEDD